jgi:hypothetical protein
MNMSLDEVDRLKNENQILRNALSELEAEKATLAHSFLGASLKIRMLLQPPSLEQNANPT